MTAASFVVGAAQALIFTLAVGLAAIACVRVVVAACDTMTKADYLTSNQDECG